MDKIKKIDDELTAIFNGFGAIADDVVFTEICELSDKDKIREQNYPGIYKIDIKNDGNHPDFQSWIGEFIPLWEHEDYKKKFTPNSKKNALLNI
ncbi:MAG: hypothetical protein PHY54_16790 [Methylococcales bacterium]|nr:hypothetical protein [Methylococcales bacterium]